MERNSISTIKNLFFKKKISVVQLGCKWAADASLRFESRDLLIKSGKTNHFFLKKIYMCRERERKRIYFTTEFRAMSREAR